MFANTFQPPLVSLFSSTGSDPLALWQKSTDDKLPADAFICLLNDSRSEPLPDPPARLIASPTQRSSQVGTQPSHLLDQTVLHIQAPSLRTTFIRCPPIGGPPLDLKHPWLCLHARTFGRPWAFDVGLMDRMGHTGVVRCATFQDHAVLKSTTPPLLILPLRLPQHNSESLTEWFTLALHLPSMVSHFSTVAFHTRDDADEEDTPTSAKSAALRAELPRGIFAKTIYVKVYATCRLRRIWFAERAPSDASPWEFGLYGA